LKAIEFLAALGPSKRSERIVNRLVSYDIGTVATSPPVRRGIADAANQVALGLVRGHSLWRAFDEAQEGPVQHVFGVRLAGHAPAGQREKRAPAFLIDPSNIRCSRHAVLA
jgi:hypothetical protein